MERLVCVYEFGWSCDIMAEITHVVEPFTYESKQKAYDDFLANMIRIEDLQKDYDKKYQEWDNRLNSISKTSPKWVEVYRQQPKTPCYDFNLGTLRLNYHNLLEQDGELKGVIIEPKFLTVDEWFKDK